MERYPRTVCVVDMDETLGTYRRDVFHVRPKLEYFVNFLRLAGIDIVLWSLGSDDYVRRVVNTHLPQIARNAHKIFGRNECKNAFRKYRSQKASQHIRVMYETEVFLIGVDDKASENMDASYDLRISVRPYVKPDSKDVALPETVEKITNALVEFYDNRRPSTTTASKDYSPYADRNGRLTTTTTSPSSVPYRRNAEEEEEEEEEEDEGKCTFDWKSCIVPYV